MTKLFCAQKARPLLACAQYAARKTAIGAANTPFYPHPKLASPPLIVPHPRHVLIYNPR